MHICFALVIIIGMRATRAKIYLENIEHNYRLIKKICPEQKICASIKANAYGHGAVRVAQTLVQAGCDFLAVATIDEGIELREALISAPILIFSPFLIDEIPQLIQYNLTPFVYEYQTVTALDNALVKEGIVDFPVHLKIDTGMGRVGCLPIDAVPLAKYITEKKNLVLQGVCTHISSADSQSRTDILYTKKQISVFTDTIKNMRGQGIKTGIVHCASSAVILNYKEALFDMVRPGILLYGYTPGNKTDCLKFEKKYAFIPAMELVTLLLFLKQVQKGEYISYGRKWRAKKTTYIATLPIGYADGLSRRLSGRGFVSIKGVDYPIVGRICMDQCMVDLGTLQTKNEDFTSIFERTAEVIIFGVKKGQTATTMANLLQTIPYEVLCAVSARVPRVYSKKS